MQGKLTYILLGLSFFLIIFITGSLFYLKYSNNNNSSLVPSPSPSRKEKNSVTGSEKNTLTNIQIVEKVLKWVNKQRNGQGNFYASRIYLSDGSEQEVVVDNRTGLGVIWGDYKYRQKVKSSESLDTLKNDLSIYTDVAKIPLLQNNFWNCKLMYDLWKDKELPSELKEKAQNICRRGTIFVPEIFPSGPLNNKVEYKTIPDVNLEDIFKEKSPVFSNDTDSKRQLAESSAFSSDFAYRYLWDSNNVDLLISKSLFNLAVGLYSQLRSQYYTQGECVLGIASLDLYKNAKEEKYLQFAKSLFDEDEIGLKCLNSADCRDSFFDKLTCNIFAKDLYKETKEIKYEDFRGSFMRDAIDNYFDSEGFAGFKKGDGSFYSSFLNKDGKRDITKDVRDNGLFAGFLLE